MTIRPVRVFALGLVLAAVVGCGPSINLATDLQVTDVSTGWFDAGIDPATGWNRLVPTITFRLRNAAQQPIDTVQLTVAFWEDGADGESNSKLVRGIGDDGLAPGNETQPIVVHNDNGYNLQGARADLFTHSGFKDWTVKLFAKRGGRIIPIGEHKVERRLIFKDAGPGL
jgi:hypothetical protein